MWNILYVNDLLEKIHMQSQKISNIFRLSGQEGCKKLRSLTWVLYIQVQSGIDVCARLRLMGVEFDGW